MLHFNQPNIERKNSVRTKKYEKLSEMCIVQHVQSVVQPIKRQVSTTVLSLLRRFEYPV